MRYFVVTQTGLFGPADAVQVAAWAREGRIGADSVLREESSGRELRAGDLPGIVFNSFQQTPVGGVVVTPAPAPRSGGPPRPIPPQIVSNYRRPDYEPPLFLASEVDGRRELLYSFLLAIGAPIIALIHIYGIFMALGGVYCAVIAIKRGRNLAIVSLILSIVAIPAALILHFWAHFLL